MDTLLVGFGILAGLISGYYLAVSYSRQFMMIFYHIPFRFWRPYFVLYDDLASRRSFSLLGGEERFKSYQAFLRMHGIMRLHLVEDFRRLWDGFAGQIGLAYGVVLIVSLGFFWGVYWAFVEPFLITQLAVLAYLYFVKRHRSDFFVILLVGLLFEDF